MRRALVTVHLWLGLVIGLLWAMQGLTGAVLVFHREVDRLTGPAATRGPMASLDAIVASAQAAADGAPIVRLAVTDGRRDLINAFYSKSAHGERHEHDHSLHAVVIDAATAKPVGARDMDPATPFFGSAMRWFDLLHMALLGGRRGEIFVGASGILLLTATLTGLWVAWPRRRGWKAAFAYDRWRTSEQRLYGWHRAIGLAVAFIFIAIASAGAYINFENAVRSWVARAVPHQPPYRPTPVSTLRVVVSPQQALDVAQTRFTQAVWVRIFMPTSQEPVYNVRLHQRGESRVWLGKTNVAVDAVSGDIVDVYDALTVPLSNRILDAAFPLHNGELAGLPGRILILLAGLLLPVLYVTGVMRWLRQRRRRRESKRSDASRVSIQRAGSRVSAHAFSISTARPTCGKANGNPHSR